MTIQILIVDDEQPIRESLSGLFEDEGYLVSTAPSGEEAVVRFRKSPADCVFLDIWMPGIDGLETMSRIKQINPNVPVIMMSGHATIDTAVKATKLGAFDFIEKPFSLDKLLIVLRNAVEKRRLELENSDLKLEQKQACPQLIGESKLISQIRKQIVKAKASDSAALLTGEHGTGKFIAAQMLHAGSARKQVPIVSFSATDTKESSVEAELFGYERGAFSGALQAQRGRLEAAHQGTLYIEEIADIPLDVQEKLLVVAQEHRLQRLGNPAKISCDVRFIISSRFSKDELLAEDKLSKGFYKHLNPLILEMPKLHQRTEDIPTLLTFLADEQAERLNGEPVRFTEEVVQALQNYHWPSNVRELRNYVERCHMLCSGQELTLKTMLPLDVDVRRVPTTMSIPDTSVLLDGFHDARKRFERSYILHHLERNDWNISKTAADIGMERSQLHRKIKAHEIVQSNQ